MSRGQSGRGRALAGVASLATLLACRPLDSLAAEERPPGRPPRPAPPGVQEDTWLRAISRPGGDPEAERELGRSRAAGGEQATAVFHLRRYLELRPEATDRQAVEEEIARALGSLGLPRLPVQPLGADAAGRDGRGRGVETTLAERAAAILRLPSSVMLGGRFLMGSSQHERLQARALCRRDSESASCAGSLFDDEPVRLCELSPYRLDGHEVTNADYARCVAARSCAAPRRSPAPGLAGPRQPVVGVSWADAQAYCAFVHKRLPSEAEWERAVRGEAGIGRLWPHGSELRPECINHGSGRGSGEDASDGHALSSDVGSYPCGATPEGIVDLAGNVWEWVADFYHPHPDAGRLPTASATAAVARDPQGPAQGGERVLRGGSYRSPLHATRGASRGHADPSTRRDDIGFRCAQDGGI